MSNFNEKLRRIYGGEANEKKEPTSWIPHRYYKKEDEYSRLRAEAPHAEGTTPSQMEEAIETNTILNACKEDIFGQVALYLLERYGEKGLEERLVHFQESWDSQYERHGDDLVIALAEMTDSLFETPFVNFNGYINKKVAKEAVRNIRTRRKDQ